MAHNNQLPAKYIFVTLTALYHLRVIAVQLPSDYKTARFTAFVAFVITSVVLFTANFFPAANLGADVLFVIWIGFDVTRTGTLMSTL